MSELWTVEYLACTADRGFWVCVATPGTLYEARVYEGAGPQLTEVALGSQAAPPAIARMRDGGTTRVSTVNGVLTVPSRLRGDPFAAAAIAYGDERLSLVAAYWSHPALRVEVSGTEARLPDLAGRQ